MSNDYTPFTGGYVWSNPYEITKYECKLSCVDAPECEMEILCKNEDALIELRRFIKSLYPIRADIDHDPSRIKIRTDRRSITDKVKDFVNVVNRRFQMNALVYYGHYFKYLKKDIDITKEMKDNMIGYKLCPVPKKIIFSGPKCIVLWHDGTKTIVSCSENDQWDEYAAYCAALAKKIYGTTSAVHREVDKKSNAKEYRETQRVWVPMDKSQGLGKILAEAMYKAMEPFIKEDNDEHSEH